MPGTGLFGIAGSPDHSLTPPGGSRLPPDDGVPTSFSTEDLLVELNPHSLSRENASATTQGGVHLWLWGDAYGHFGTDGYKTRSDGQIPGCAEYCSRLYDEFGIDFVSRVNGEFAGVAYDPETDLLSLFTDRLGSRPIYLARSGESVVFSTDLRSVASHTEGTPFYDLGLLAEFFTFNRCFGVRTPIRQIERLPPSSIVTIDLSTLKTETNRYWHPVYDPVDRSFSWFVDRFTELFEKAVTDRTRGELDYAVLLSGGSDSRAIVTANDRPLTAYTITGWMNREARTAERVALTAEIDFEWLRRDREYLPNLVDPAGSVNDFTGYFWEAHPLGFVDHIREDTDVLLHGGFCDAFFKGQIFDRKRVPGTGTSLPFADVPDDVGSFRDDWESLMGRPGLSEIGLPHYLSMDEDLTDVLHEEITEKDGTIDHHGVRYPSLENAAIASKYYPLTNRPGYFFHGSTVQTIPTRAPFLDYRLIDLHLSMPVEYQLRRNVVNRAIERLDPELAAIPHAGTRAPLSRSPLVHAARRRVPFPRPDRPPRPYLTQGSWTNHEELIRTHGFVREVIDRNERRIRELPFLEWEKVVECYEAHLDGVNNTAELYALVTFLSMPSLDSE